MRRLTVLRSAAIAFVLGLSACSMLLPGNRASPYGTGDPKLTAPNVSGGPICPFLANGHAVLRAIDAIRAQVGRPFRVTDINVDAAIGMRVELQEPAHHDRVDEYAVATDGTLTGPNPVQLMSMSGAKVTARDVDAEAVDPKKIGVENLARRVREALARTHVADMRIANWEYHGGVDARRVLYFQSSRARATALLGPHFEIESVEF